MDGGENGAEEDWEGFASGSWRDRAIAWRNRALVLFDHVPVPIALCGTDGTILLANPAMAMEWGVLPSRLKGRGILELFDPRTTTPLHSIAEAVRLGRRSRYPIEVSWPAPDGTERYGEMNVDLVGPASGPAPNLLLVLRVREDHVPESRESGADARVSAVEARILALAAGGSTTARIAKSVGLTLDGVNYHLGRLSRRWNVPNRTALIARAYALGVLDPHRWPPEAAGD
jgi:PAS domain S-box-containing protein